MKHHIFNTADHYQVALLLKPTAFDKSAVKSNYVDPLVALGLREDVIAVTTDQGASGKPTAKEIKAYLETLLPGLKELGACLLYVADSAYFKVLTKQGKAEPHAGYVLPCAIKGYEDLQVVLGLNYQQLIYDPSLQSKLTASLETVVAARNGTYVAPGSHILHTALYPKTLEEIKQALLMLLEKPELTCDIEAFSLRFNEAGIGTIAFAWSEHEGVAFPVDYTPLRAVSSTGEYAYRTNSILIKSLLKEFFEHYKGNLTFHNAAYDAKIIIYNLWMKDALDTEGLLHGLEVMCKNLDDTKIIAYLAYNSTAGNVLKLKALAHEFAGNYAVDEINDIRRIPLDKLLEYNLVDALSTFYIKKRDYPIMVQDMQLDIYQNMMLPSLKLIIQIELSGMPMDMLQVHRVATELEAESQSHLDIINNSPLTKQFNRVLQERLMKAANAKLKKKQHPIEAFADAIFNPNSGPQLQAFLYDMLGLPVLDFTDTKQPATGGDTLKKLLNHTKDQQTLDLLNALIGYAGVEKILTAFIPAFKKAMLKSDGHHYLHGSFNIGGTVSGRLSSSNPNLQQLPSNSMYGKLIKKCFKAAPGWLFCGADFNALEDRVNTLLTKDPNKIKVFTEGYDSHCLRAFYFFPDKLPGIQETVASINSIKTTFPEIRQLAKAPAFALQYAGTWRTLVTTLGFSEEEAKKIEANYHKMYSVSDAWVKAKVHEASLKGYSTTAFGLRIRTPLLGQVLLGSGAVPREAEAEARTLGNAVSGQSYGLLNNRAAIQFMEEVWKSPFKLDIKPIALIHDSIYLTIKDDVRVVEWVNKVLVECMEWQNLPEIQHNEVKLGSNLEICWPTWANTITLPNGASQKMIRELTQKAKEDYGKSL